MRNSGHGVMRFGCALAAVNPQVVTGKGPIAVALGACDYCKIWGLVALEVVI